MIACENHIQARFPIQLLVSNPGSERWFPDSQCGIICGKYNLADKSDVMEQLIQKTLNLPTLILNDSESTIIENHLIDTQRMEEEVAVERE